MKDCAVAEQKLYFSFIFCDPKWHKNKRYLESAQEAVRSVALSGMRTATVARYEQGSVRSHTLSMKYTFLIKTKAEPPC